MINPDNASSSSTPPKPVRTATAPNSQGFFQPSPEALTAETIDQATVNQLLLHVVQGKQDEAEAMLKKDPGLALHKGTVTDYSNRTFKNITAFQYALWALDWHMWSMILKYYLPEDAAKAQLEALESQGTAHGTHYDFTPLIRGLTAYRNMRKHALSSYDFSQCQQDLTQGVGRAQRTAPAHVANEYCRDDRSFDPRPPFNEETLPRTVVVVDEGKGNKSSAWYPLEEHAGLGFSGAVIRASKPAAAMERKRDERLERLHIPDFNLVSWSDSATDLAAITALCQVRNAQLDELKQQLLTQPQNAPPRP